MAGAGSGDHQVMHILLVEDETAIADPLAEGLTVWSGWSSAPTTTSSGRSACAS